LQEKKPGPFPLSLKEPFINYTKCSSQLSVDEKVSGDARGERERERESNSTRR